MPVIAMEVTHKAAHEKTDQLFIYTFHSPSQGEKTIVANLTNVYELGDVAGIAGIGTFTEEGEIKPRKVFGIASDGMAMGPVDAPVDTDVTEHFGADAPERTFTLSFEIQVQGRYASDAEKAARKLFKSGAGTLIQAE